MKMKVIKLAYSDLYNAGDLMNISIVEKLSGYKVERCKTFAAEMIAIGGALYGLQYSDRIEQNIAQHVLKLFYGNKPIYVWGSGFWHNNNNNGLYRKNLKVCALRGALSQKKLQNLTGKFYDVPLADAGLLVDMLFSPETVSKEYKIGLIPHMSQQNDEVMRKLKNQNEIHIIDIKQMPQEVGREIAKCECILSSSLHGLIFADSLNIPNMHIRCRHDLPEGNFKFEDYYSSYGLKDAGVFLEDHVPTFQEVIESYKVQPQNVKEKRELLLRAFLKFKGDKNEILFCGR